jgi:hypothetical protein
LSQILELLLYQAPEIILLGLEIKKQNESLIWGLLEDTVAEGVTAC